MADLPDYYTMTQISEAEAAKFKGGLDANKSAAPVSRDLYLATDTLILYICVADGTWTGFDASILVQGTLTLYENMDANSKKITSLAAPTADNDAARKKYVDDSISGDVSVHAALTTGVHGVGASTIASAADIATHAVLTTTHGVTGTILGTEDVDDTPVNGATTAPVSSNWAFDHNAAATGVHGAGANTLATDADITTHAALTTGVHGAGANTLATDADIATHAALTETHGASGNIVGATTLAADIATHAALTETHGVTGAILGTEDVDDTPVDGATTAPVSSNWAYDHVAAADPHTGYRLESTRIGKGDMEWTTDKLLKGAGIGNDPIEIDVSVGTKEFFAPVTAGTEMANYGTYPVAICDAAYEWGRMSFRVPHDFSSIATAEVVVLCRATQAAANWDIYSNYAAAGEVYNTHSESDDASTYNVTDSELEVVDISGILSSLAANDYVGIKISQGAAGHNFNVLGIHFKYN